MPSYEKWVNYEPAPISRQDLKKAYENWRKRAGIQLVSCNATGKSIDSNDYRHAKYKGKVDGVKIK